MSEEEKRRERRFAEVNERRELLELFREQLQVPYAPFPDRRAYYKKRKVIEQRSGASPKDHEPGSER